MKSSFQWVNSSLLHLYFTVLTWCHFKNKKLQSYSLFIRLCFVNFLYTFFKLHKLVFSLLLL